MLMQIITVSDGVYSIVDDNNNVLQTVSNKPQKEINSKKFFRLVNSGLIFFRKKFGKIHVKGVDFLIEHEEIKVTLGGLSFTWDDEKARINKKKHNISFSTAAYVFLDTNAIIEFNSIDENTGEERFSITGMVFQGVLFVVYVERIDLEGNNVFRIISARRAEREERDIYVYGTR